MSKTPEYIKKAVSDYRKRHYFIQVAIPMEYKERLQAVGISGTVAKNLILEELERREAEKNV